jgi:hypothetical protein
VYKVYIKKHRATSKVTQRVHLFFGTKEVKWANLAGKEGNMPPNAKDLKAQMMAEAEEM